MKRTTKYIIGLGAVAALTSSAFVGVALTDDKVKEAVRGHHSDQVELAQGGKHHGKARRARFGSRHGGFRGHFGERMLEQFDADKDGKLTQAEIDKSRAEQHAKFDSDKDGKLNLKEYESLWLDVMRKRMVDAFQRHDDDGDAAVTAAEFQERFKNFVARADRNEDGAFTRDDIRKRGHKGRRGRHGGPGGREL